MKKMLFLIIVVAIFGLLVFFNQNILFLKVVNKEPITVLKEFNEFLEINFTKTGSILNWDSQTETYTENWILLYEEPGKPALSVKLVFNENSFCTISQEEKICDKADFNNGDRAEVRGHRKDKIVIVTSLIRL